MFLVFCFPFLQIRNTKKFDDARAKGVLIVGESFLKTGKVDKVFGDDDRVEHNAEDADFKRVTYQYMDHIWKDYDESAHGIVEAAYQDWLHDKEVDARNIKSGEFIYSVDFASMTQTNMQVPPHTQRAIRRLVDGEVKLEDSPKKKKAPVKEEEEEAEDKPKKRATKKKAPAKKAKKDKEEDEDEEKEEELEEEEDKPKPRAKKAGASAPKKRSKKGEDEEDEEDEEAPKSKKAAPSKKGAASKASGSGVLKGLVFCITGKLSNPRSHYESLINANGGSVAKSLTKAVTHVISAKGESDTTKLNKARDNGVLVLTEEFLTDAIEDQELPTALEPYLIDE